MDARTPRRAFAATLLSLAAVLLAGCGNSVEGTYIGSDDSLLHSLDFRDDGKVNVTIVNGIGGEGTYEVSGDIVHVSANGTTHELRIGDDDCLHGPLTVGTLCKEEPSSAGTSDR